MHFRFDSEYKNIDVSAGRFFSCHFLRASIVSGNFPVSKMRHFQVQNMTIKHQLYIFDYQTGEFYENI